MVFIQKNFMVYQRNQTLWINQWIWQKKGQISFLILQSRFPELKFNLEYLTDDSKSRRTSKSHNRRPGLFNSIFVHDYLGFFFGSGTSLLLIIVTVAVGVSDRRNVKHDTYFFYTKKCQKSHKKCRKRAKNLKKCRKLSKKAGFHSVFAIIRTPQESQCLLRVGFFKVRKALILKKSYEQSRCSRDCSTKSFVIDSFIKTFRPSI